LIIKLATIKNKKHYRWRAFTAYLEFNKEIDEEKFRELYRLGEIDADNYGMGASMKINLLQQKKCPDDLVQRALNSGDKPLVKVARRKLGLEYK
jgi:hypothetical protein